MAFGPRGGLDSMAKIIGYFKALTPLLPAKNELRNMTYFSNDLQIDAQESLILFLVLELRKGASSDLHWYLKHLPRNFNSILRNFPEKFVPFLSDQDKGFI